MSFWLEHGDCGTRFYNIWHNMKARSKQQSKKWGHYYKDVSLDPRWKKYLNFKEDMYASYERHVKEFGAKETTLDRIDPYGDYTLSNCRWATWKEQRSNQKLTPYINWGKPKSFV